jgi:hypothetical protein
MCNKHQTTVAGLSDSLLDTLKQFTITVLQQKTMGVDEVFRHHTLESTDEQLLASLKIPLLFSLNIEHTPSYIMRIARKTIKADSVITRNAAQRQTTNFAENIIFSTDDMFYNAIIAPVVFRMHTMLLLIAENVTDAPILKKWLKENAHNLETYSKYLTGAALSVAIRTTDETDVYYGTQDVLVNVLSGDADARLTSCYQLLLEHLKKQNRLPDSAGYRAAIQKLLVKHEIEQKFVGETKDAAVRRLAIAEEQHRQYLDPDSYSAPPGFNKHAACILGLVCYTMRIDILLYLATQKINIALGWESAVSEELNFGSRSRRDERRGRRGPTASWHV